MTDMSVPRFMLQSVKHRIPRDKKCTMCGEAKAKHAIWNPNKFPNTDERNPEDIWDVCQDCKKFVEQGVRDSYAMLGLEVLLRHGDDISWAKDHPVYGNAHKMLTDIKEVKNDESK